jgi:hypothetical protein
MLLEAFFWIEDLAPFSFFMASSTSIFPRPILALTEQRVQILRPQLVHILGHLDADLSNLKDVRPMTVPQIIQSPDW